MNDKPMLFWYQNNKVLYTKDFNQFTPEVAVESSSAALSNYSLAMGENNSLSLLWGKGTGTSQEINVAVYDPTFDSWSKPIALTDNGAINDNITATLDSSGNILAVYNKTDVITQDGHPAFDETDLTFSELTVGRDLSIEAEDITFSPENPAPGGSVTVTAIVNNKGELADKDIPVAFYDGNPLNGGQKIGEEMISSVLAAGDGVSVSVNWQMPAGIASHEVYVLVDPENLKADRNRTNNTAHAGATSPDLSITALAKQLGEYSNKYLVKYTAANGGYLPATNTVVTLARDSDQETVLAEKSLGSLDPGQVKEDFFTLEANAPDFSNGIMEIIVRAKADGQELQMDNNFTEVYITAPERTDNVPIKAFSLAQKSLSLKPGEKEALIEIIQPSDASNRKVYWNSNNENIASVDKDGMVMALRRGTTTVTASTEDGSFTATATITVQTASNPPAGNVGDDKNVVIHRAVRDELTRDSFLKGSEILPGGGGE